ncbi:MAG: MmcQ/YjbR family DNA-binding protein [Cyclobacteriaceae bacterium]|nr:MmcQ/YjbR family DNA-binding protein [Cyclobacteriaceae bacterium]MCH8517200.1 MmcQ/YjbR family DNA-binding protein [Cyclobacteriaceae bacterium]
MNIASYRNFCLSLKGVTEEFPFDENTLVFKVMDKMFTATDVDTFESINVKCEPEYAEELRASYSAVLPGYHMNKKHWNTLLMDGSLTDDEVYGWIKDSYDLVVAKLTKKEKELLRSF